MSKIEILTNKIIEEWFKDAHNFLNNPVKPDEYNTKEFDIEEMKKITYATKDLLYKCLEKDQSIDTPCISISCWTMLSLTWQNSDANPTITILEDDQNNEEYVLRFTSTEKFFERTYGQNEIELLLTDLLLIIKKGNLCLENFNQF